MFTELNEAMSKKTRESMITMSYQISNKIKEIEIIIFKRDEYKF
jgi:hypothetical protein